MGQEKEVKESRGERVNCCTPSPAVNNVGAIGRSLEVSQSPDEGDDRVGVVRNAKVWPTRVVELLHLTSVVATAHPVRPYGVVGQLLNLDKGHREITQC